MWNIHAILSVKGEITVKKLFIGYLLAALAFTVHMANGCALVLPPPFVGVVIMVLGCKELKDADNRFGAAMAVGAVVAVLLAAEWLTMLFGWAANYIALINSVTPLLRLVFDFLFIWGIGDLERAYGIRLFGSALRVLWVLQFVEAAVVLLGMLSPLLVFFSLVGVLAGVVLSVIFVVMLYRSQKEYEYLRSRGVIGR